MYLNCEEVFSRTYDAIWLTGFQIRFEGYVDRILTNFTKEPGAPVGDNGVELGFNSALTDSTILLFVSDRIETQSNAINLSGPLANNTIIIVADKLINHPTSSSYDARLPTIYVRAGGADNNFYLKADRVEGPQVLSVSSSKMRLELLVNNWVAKGKIENKSLPAIAGESNQIDSFTRLTGTITSHGYNQPAIQWDSVNDILELRDVFLDADDPGSQNNLAASQPVTVNVDQRTIDNSSLVPDPNITLNNISF